MKTILFITAVAAMSCQPNGGRPECSIDTELPTITPVGAVDCGALDWSLPNEPQFAASVVCTNDAIRSQAPFVLKMKHRYMRNPNCPPTAFCIGPLVVSHAYVGEILNGRYRVTLYGQGTPGIHRDSTQDAGVELDGSVVETFVRQECYPPAGAGLRQHIEGSSALSLQCTVEGSSDLVEIHSLPYVASCPPR